MFMETPIGSPFSSQTSSASSSPSPSSSPKPAPHPSFKIFEKIFDVDAHFSENETIEIKPDGTINKFVLSPLIQDPSVKAKVQKQKEEIESHTFKVLKQVGELLGDTKSEGTPKEIKEIAKKILTSVKNKGLSAKEENLLRYDIQTLLRTYSPLPPSVFQEAFKINLHEMQPNEIVKVAADGTATKESFDIHHEDVNLQIHTIKVLYQAAELLRGHSSPEADKEIGNTAKKMLKQLKADKLSEQDRWNLANELSVYLSKIAEGNLLIQRHSDNRNKLSDATHPFQTMGRDLDRLLTSDSESVHIFDEKNKDLMKSFLASIGSAQTKEERGRDILEKMVDTFMERLGFISGNTLDAEAKQIQTFLQQKLQERTIKTTKTAKEGKEEAEEMPKIPFALQIQSFFDGLRTGKCGEKGKKLAVLLFGMNQMFYVNPSLDMRGALGHLTGIETIQEKGQSIEYKFIENGDIQTEYKASILSKNAPLDNIGRPLKEWWKDEGKEEVKFKITITLRATYNFDEQNNPIVKEVVSTDIESNVDQPEKNELIKTVMNGLQLSQFNPHPPRQVKETTTL